MNNVRIYIASPIKNSEFNRQIAEMIQSKDIKYFLPESIGLHDKNDTILQIGEITYSEIEKSSHLLVLYPFGLSTAAEIGYAVGLKKQSHPINIILLNFKNELPRLDANITPYYDKVINSIPEFKEWLDDCRVKMYVSD